MKKKIRNSVIVVACAASIATLGNVYVKKCDTIGSQQERIEELLILNKRETEKAKTLSEEKLVLIADLDSARRGIIEAGEAIERTNSEIKQLEIKIEQERQRALEKERVEKTEESIPPTTTGRKIRVKVTGYCSCVKCCGEWALSNPGITASGTRAKFGTVAAPPSLPFGTRMKIEGYGDQVFTVEDTGSAVVQNGGVYTIDIWMPTHEQAYAVGNRIVDAIILE